jgi:hypothetical protein
MQRILNGHVEGGCETQRSLCGGAELADLVIGDDGLDDVTRSASSRWLKPRRLRK